MKQLDRIPEWGKDIERIVYWAPKTNRRQIYKSNDLLTGRTIIYIDISGQSCVAKLQDIEIDNTDKENKYFIRATTSNGSDLLIECDLQTIPYGFDMPTRYELVVRGDIQEFEVLGDYYEIKHDVQKNRTIARAIHQFCQSESKNS